MRSYSLGRRFTTRGSTRSGRSGLTTSLHNAAPCFADLSHRTASRRKEQRGRIRCTDESPVPSIVMTASRRVQFGGCDRAGARDYAAFLGFFFLEPS